MKSMYQNLPIYEQSCNLWEWKKVQKQRENKFFRFKNMTREKKILLKTTAGEPRFGFYWYVYFMFIIIRTLPF